MHMTETNPIVTDIFQIINDRRSIRTFLDKPISDDVLNKIIEAGLKAPFAAQLCSIVYTKDKERAKSLGIYTYPTAPVTLVFFVDVYRLEKILKARGHDYTHADMMSLWSGIQLLGVAPVRAEKIAKVFKVPERVFPVVGMSLGYPDLSDETEVRPRFPLHQSAFEDEYRDHSESDIQECMEKMDAGYIAQGYYIKKRIKVPLEDGEDTIGFDKYSWSEHISRKFRHRRWESNPLLSILKEQGFNFVERNASLDN